MVKKQFMFMIASILMFTLFLGMGSADLIFHPDLIEQSATHNSAFTYNFNIENTGPAFSADNITYTFSNLVQGNLLIGEGNLSLTNTYSTIANNTNQSFVLNVNIPEYTQAGIYEGYLTVEGICNGATVSDILTIKVNVSEEIVLSISSPTISSTVNSTSVTITNEGNSDITDIAFSIENIEGASFDYSSDNFTLVPGESKEIDVGITYTSALNIGDNVATINVVSEEISQTSTLTIQRDFCEECENPGNLKIDGIDIKVLKGFGDDDNYWYLLDKIEVELDVENNGAWDVRKIEVEWTLYNTAGDKIMDGTEDTFKLKDGDSTKTIFVFTLDEDMDKFDGEDAILFVKVKGEIDDNDAPEDGEDTCASSSVEVDVNSNDDFVIATEFEINGVEVEDIFYDSFLCGQEITLNGKVWNIGDQDQDDVSLVIYNNALGIYQTIKFDEVKAFDYETFSFTFVVPQELEKQNYYISFEVFDEDNDLFENSEDDKARVDLIAKVEGFCELFVPIITIEPLDSEVSAGGTMVVKAIITNPGEEQMILTLGADGIEGWATLRDIEPKIVILEAGATQEVMITLTLSKDSEGEHSFNILVLKNEEIIQSVPVEVTVGESSFSFKDLFNKIDTKLALIILVNLILVIAIVVVAVRVRRR
jgi:uncharacterized membrane protein